MERAAKLAKQVERAERAYDAQSQWLQQLVTAYGGLWRKRFTELKSEDLTPEDIGTRMYQNSVSELEGLNNELATMIQRTGIIVAAATFLLAAYAFLLGHHLVVPITLTVVSFSLSILSIAPPVRAWTSNYVTRFAWTVIAVTDRERWTLNCWLSDRRSPIIQRYKRAHHAAAWLLVGATVIAAVIALQHGGI
jgi:hypothetical protein